MTSAPFLLKASEIRFPAIAAPPVVDKSDMDRILRILSIHRIKSFVIMINCGLDHLIE